MSIVHSQIALVLLLATATVASAPFSRAQNPPLESAPSSSHPETTDGLKQLVSDIAASAALADDTRFNQLVDDLQIPHHAAWFAANFGSEEATRLDATYLDFLGHQRETFRHRFSEAIKKNSLVPSAAVQQESDGPNSVLHFLRPAMLKPVVLYSAELSDASGKSPTLAGSFVYVDGGFRSIERVVWFVLSTAPPMRIRIGGNVMAAKLMTYNIQPVYPPEAVKEQAAGDVRLHAIVAVDGRIKELEVISGPQSLQAAAIEAVRRWSYQPTLLNGKPVEVETTIEVIFTLNK